MSAQTTINPSASHGWSANTGWQNWRGDGPNGVRVGEYVCAGNIYAGNLGWISVGDGSPSNGIRYQNASASDFGVNRDPEGRLTGLAYGANIGWLIFTNRTAAGTAYPSPTVNIQTGRLSGFVYGQNVGWISLSNQIAHVQTDVIEPGRDQDRDGMADAWELGYVGNLVAMNSATDQDKDSFWDVDEYRADTDPLSDTDLLEVSRFVVEPDTETLWISWPSKATRRYSIHFKSELDDGAPWLDSGLGVLDPAPGGSNSHAIPFPDPGAAYFRIEAITPLAP